MRRPLSCWDLLLVTLTALLSPVVGFCPQRCQCDDEIFLADCTSAGLNSFPISLNPRLRRLLLADNTVRRLDTSMVSSYMALEYLDVRRNGMLSVQAGSFAYQPQLRQLLLSDNKLSELEPAVFSGLEQLRQLDLSRNLLASLPDGLLRGTPLLQTLDLTGNRLTVLTQSVLAGAVSLRSLSLANNRLTEVPVAALSPLTSLDTLSLAGNDLKRLAAGDLATAVPALTDLNLAGNRGLAAVLDGGGALAGLMALRRLQLADTGLSVANAATFVGLERLQELHLGGNPLSRLGAAPFAPLHRLRLLSVRACPGFNTFEPDTFLHNPALETLRLEENPSLTRLPAGLLLRLPLLRRLSLHANALTSLKADTADWQQLSAAELAANPWQCNCALRWLAELPPAVNVSGAICAAPPPLRGLPVRGLTTQQLGCSGAGGGGGGGRTAVVAGAVGGGLILLLLVAALLCCRHRRQLHNVLKILPWRDRVGLKRKQPHRRSGTTYYCHDVYDPIHARDSKPIPVTEL